ncbi:hypothetical protein V7150_14795 [Neobacillus drentensis]|uniref:hypothetical protein n=1 Tax=Neobacillus drentensis TaxID=220684 RepID=UPI002FFDA04E
MRIGIYILKNEALVHMTKQFFNEEIARKAELYRDIPANAVEMMRKRTRELKFQYKMTLSVFKGSSILNQLKILEVHPMDVEVCASVFLREYNIWNQKQEVKGCLKITRGTILWSFSLGKNHEYPLHGNSSKRRETGIVQK